MRAITLETLETVLVALTVFLLLQASIQSFRVEGFSMEPTLDNGQYLLVNKLVYFRPSAGIISRLLSADDGEPEPLFAFHPPRRGDVIVFLPPGGSAPDYVKRVIGLPGDVVSMSRGNVYVNGKLLPEPYLVNQDSYSMEPLTVPAGKLFVLGDNRFVSADSRAFGFVPMENVVGQAWLVFWPLERSGLVGTAPALSAP